MFFYSFSIGSPFVRNNIYYTRFQDEMEKKERDSGLELLRILAIVLIFWMHGASSYSNNNLSAWLCIVIESVGNIGVALFILITGYIGEKRSFTAARSFFPICFRSSGAFHGILPVILRWRCLVRLSMNMWRKQTKRHFSGCCLRCLLYFRE